MTGAIKVAESITKHLEGFDLLVIETVAAGEPDSAYVRENRRGEWEARERHGRTVLG